MGNIPKGVYRHYKGKLYQVVEFCIHSESLETMVLYKALYASNDFKEGTLWVRPLKMFTEVINYEGKSIPRFAFIDN